MTLPDQMFFRLRDLATLTGIPRATLYRLARSGRLAYATVSSVENPTKPTILITREAAQGFIDGLHAAADRAIQPAPEQSRLRPFPPRSKRGRPKSA